MKNGIHRFQPCDINLIGSEVASCIREAGIESWSREKNFYSMWRDGKVIAIGGVITIHPGVGEAVIVCEDDLNGDRFMIARKSRELIEKLFENGSFHRLQSRAAADNEIHNRYIRFLGFRKEGILKGYGLHGEDYFIYARVKKWQP